MKSNRLDLALALIDKIKSNNEDILNTVHYTTVIKGLGKAGKLDEAL